MRNKRLIILISVIVGVVALIIIMSAVFTVYNIEARCAENYTAANEAETNRVSAEVVAAAEDFRYHSIFLFDEDELADTVNANVTRAEVLNVECLFPNKVRIEYRYVDDDLYVPYDGRYLVAGSYGKITQVLDSKPSGEEIVEVTPSSGPSGTQAGQYLYGEGSFDITALDVFFNYAEGLTDSDENKFRAQYANIDLSDALHTYAPTITLTMKDGLEFVVNGSVPGPDGTTDFSFNDENTLKNAVRTLASWYAENASSAQGTVIVQYAGGGFVVEA